MCAFPYLERETTERGERDGGGKKFPPIAAIREEKKPLLDFSLYRHSRCANKEGKFMASGKGELFLSLSSNRGEKSQSRKAFFTELSKLLIFMTLITV